MTRLPSLSVQAFALALTVAVAFLFSVTSFAATSPKWTDLAKKVGTSEDVRGGAIQQLKAMKGLKDRLKKAIYTVDRPLALDVISALEMKELVPDLLLHVPADPDGFLTIAVNAMMSEKNQSQILTAYQEILEPGNIKRVSPAAIVAMLEPLGRLAVKLPEAVLQELKDHASPEVRSSTLYYFRVMALRHQSTDHLEFVTELLKAKEFQIRLQAVSITSEILDRKISTSSLVDRSGLRSLCREEKAKQVREACLGFIANGETK